MAKGVSQDGRATTDNDGAEGRKPVAMAYEKGYITMTWQDEGCRCGELLL